MSLTPRRGTLAGAKAAAPATQARPRTTVRMVIKEGITGNARAASLYVDVLASKSHASLMSHQFKIRQYKINDKVHHSSNKVFSRYY